MRPSPSPSPSPAPAPAPARLPTQEKRCTPIRRPDGFTVVEILLALVLLGILTAVALPVYRENIARARRSELQAALLEDAGYLQRYAAAHGGFAGDPAPRLPFPASPLTGPAAYAIVVAVPADDPTRFLLTAARTGAMRDDRCGDFTYDHLGRRGLVADSFAAGESVQSCWR